ncbi:MAG: hypothetical protein AAGH40_00020 [Verrucomicrobiota bacterium]
MNMTRFLFLSIVSFTCLGLISRAEVRKVTYSGTAVVTVTADASSAALGDLYTFEFTHDDLVTDSNPLTDKGEFSSGLVSFTLEAQSGNAGSFDPSSVDFTPSLLETTSDSFSFDIFRLETSLSGSFGGIALATARLNLISTDLGLFDDSGSGQTLSGMFGGALPGDLSVYDAGAGILLQSGDLAGVLLLDITSLRSTVTYAGKAVVVTAEVGSPAAVGDEFIYEFTYDNLVMDTNAFTAFGEFGDALISFSLVSADAGNTGTLDPSTLGFSPENFQILNNLDAPITDAVTFGSVVSGSAEIDGAILNLATTTNLNTVVDTGLGQTPAEMLGGALTEDLSVYDRFTNIRLTQVAALVAELEITSLGLAGAPEVLFFEFSKRSEEEQIDSGIPFPNAISIGLDKVNLDDTVEVMLTDSLNNTIQGEATVGGESIFFGFDASLLVDGPVQVDITTSDILGDVKTFTDSFVLDSTAEITVALNRTSFRNTASTLDLDPTELTISGTTVSVETGQTVEIFFEGVDGDLSAQAEVQADSTYSLGGENLQPASRFLGELNTIASNAGTGTSVAELTDGRFIAAWVSPDLISGNFVNYQLFNTDASFAGGPVTINSDTSQTAYVVPTANGGWAIGWLEGGTVKQQTFASDGTAGSVINVASSAREPTAAPLVGGGWIVVFEKNVNELFYQLYDSSGVALGSETLAGSGFDPRVTGLSNSGWAIAAFINASDANIQVFGFESDGTPVAPPVAANSGHRGFSPVIASLNNGRWVVTWVAENGLDGTGDTAIAFQRFDADGTPAGSNTLASAIAYDSESLPSIASTGGAGFVLSWTGAASSLRQRVFRFFNSTGLPLTGNGRLTGEINGNFALGLGASTLRRSNGETIFVYSRSAGVARYAVETLGCIDSSDPFRILGDGEVTVTAAVSDLSGNLATATTTIDAQYDRDVDVVSIAASSTTVPNGSPVTLTVVLERPTDFFDLSRIQKFYVAANNAQLQTDGVVATTDDGTTWEFAIYPWRPGNLTGSFRPLIFNRKSNIEGPQISLTEDTTAPTLISVVPTSDTLKVGQDIRVIFTFSEPVSSNDIITITPTTAIANPNVDLDQASFSFFISSLVSTNFFFVDFSFFTGVSAGETVTYTIDETALGITDRAGFPLAESGDFSFDITILPDAYVSYAMGLGITEFGRLVDTDNDDLPDWNEWMHNQNATVANDPLFTHLEVITIEGEDYFSITIPSADGLVYEGFSNGGTAESLQTFLVEESFEGPVTALRNSTDLISFDSPLGWLEVIPAVDSGLPALPVGYGYRTFRFAEPLSQQDRGFIQIEQTPATDFDDL